MFLFSLRYLNLYRGARQNLSAQLTPVVPLVWKVYLSYAILFFSIQRYLLKKIFLLFSGVGKNEKEHLRISRGDREKVVILENTASPNPLVMPLRNIIILRLTQILIHFQNIKLSL